MIHVRPVSSRADWNIFKRVPALVYRRDPNWLKEESVDLDAVLIQPDPALHQGREFQAYVAYDRTTPVGRIVAIADHSYIRYQQDPSAFFGFYEAIADHSVAFALLDAAAEWARCKSLKRLIGPMNPALVYSAGMLVEGGDRPPLVGMPYNPAYYAEQMGAWGMHKLKDMHSYFLVDPYSVLYQLNGRLWDRWQARSSITFRSLNFRRFEAEVEQVRHIYNASFVHFWGFTPLHREEFLQLAYSFKPILDPDLVLFALLEDQPVGFLMAIPDVNPALLRASHWNHPLLRTLSTLWHLKGPCRRRTIRHTRVDMLAVHPDCRDPGTGALLIFELLRRVRDRGYASAEAAPLLDTTHWWNSMTRHFLADPYRTYRIFARELDASPSS